MANQTDTSLAPPPLLQLRYHDGSRGKVGLNWEASAGLIDPKYDNCKTRRKAIHQSSYGKVLF
jgi:hypothetical protein